MKSYIYADNAATTKLDADVFEIMKPYMLGEFGNPSQPYSFSRRPKAALKEARNIIAECIHALPEEIFFTSGGTESDNWAIKSAVSSCEKNKRIITSAFEHHADRRPPDGRSAARASAPGRQKGDLHPDDQSVPECAGDETGYPASGPVVSALCEKEKRRNTAAFFCGLSDSPV